MISIWPYHFITVTEEQKQQRREALDLRGYYAQCSALILIILLHLYRNYILNGTSTETKGRRVPIRPGEKSWWDSPLFKTGVETRRQYLAALLWLSWLLGLSVWNSGDDYLHLTKALGHVAVSQLPLQVLMSPVSYINTSKPVSPSAMSILTSIPQHALTPYHRLFGRMVLAPLLFGHATLYLFFFGLSEHPEFGILLWKRIQDLDVQLGIAGLLTIISLATLARPMSQTRGLQLGLSSMTARRQVFYVLHVLLVAGMATAAYFHVSYARKYVLEALGCFLVNVACCWVPRN